MTTLQQQAESDSAPWTIANRNAETLSAAGIFGKRQSATSGLTWAYYGGLYNGNTIADGTVTLTNAATNYVVALRSTGVVSTSTSSTNSLDPLYAKLYTLTVAGSVVTVEVDSRWDANGLLFNTSGAAGTVTSVDASGGVQTVAGTPISGAGTIRAAQVVNAQTGTTYTVVTGDRGKLLTISNAAAISVTLPQAGGTFPDGWFVDVQCIGAGTATITPTTSTINGAATLVLTTGLSARIVSDGTNYQALTGGSSGGAVATDVIWDAAGDLAVGTGANTAARLAIGTALQVLRVNAGATALEWAAAGGGGSGTKSYAVFTPMTSQPPASNFATLDTRNSIAVLDFDDTTEESCFWVGVMPEAASLGSGLIVNIFFMTTSATSGDCRFGAQFERMTTDEDSDSFDTATEATVATSGTSGIVTKLAITCTTIDSIAAGEAYRLKVYRDTTGADTITGDVEVVAVEVRSAA